jgi:hypothetical protein
MEKITGTKLLPSIFVGKDIVRKRVSLYQEKKHPLLSEALSTNGKKKEETKSIWYSKEHIETLLSEMNLVKADGLRFYLGAYDENDSIAPGQICLLVVPTRTSNDGKLNKDIIIEDEYPERLALTNNRSFETEEAAKPRGYNYGSPCPPICIVDETLFP